MSGAELGKIITDKSVAFYADTDEDVTLSIIDLSKVNDVLQAMGDLMAACK